MALKVFCTCSNAVTEIELVEAVHSDEVAEKAFDTIKPSRVFPVLEKDTVKEDPSAIVMLYAFPSAWKVGGEGSPPFMVTVALGAELLMVTVIDWLTELTVYVAEAELELASVIVTV